MILDNVHSYSPDPLQSSSEPRERTDRQSRRFVRAGTATPISWWRFARWLHLELDSRLKRTLDLVAAAGLLTILGPLFAVIGIAIKLESPGPVFFKQVRNGVRGKRFLVWKFRSMRADAEQVKDKLQNADTMSDGLRFKMKVDPRVTRVGRLLRASSLDELPQLINVLRGEMSLVGPRPPIPKEVADYSARDRRRLDTVPGITCIWQVSGRSEIPFVEQVEMDIDYLHRRSFSFDLELLLRTIPAVLLARGAY